MHGDQKFVKSKHKVTEVAWATLTHNALQEFTVALVLNTA